MKAVVVLLRKMSGLGLDLDLYVQTDLEPIVTTQELPTASAKVWPCLLLPCVLCVVCGGSQALH